MFSIAVAPSATAFFATTRACVQTGELTSFGGTGSMSLFDHLLFGANVDGVGSRTHASLLVYALAPCSAEVNRADMLIVRCPMFNRRSTSPRSRRTLVSRRRRAGGSGQALGRRALPTREVYIIHLPSQGYHAPGLKNFACGARAVRV